MNMYQGLLFLHGFRVLPEDVAEAGAAAGERLAAVAPDTGATPVAVQVGVGTAVPAAGA